eukprot:7379715-Prymnesium_polylepis.1
MATIRVMICLLSLLGAGFAFKVPAQSKQKLGSALSATDQDMQQLVVADLPQHQVSSVVTSASTCETGDAKMNGTGEFTEAFSGVPCLEWLRLVNLSACILVMPASRSASPIWFKRQSNGVDWCWTPYASNKVWIPVQTDRVDKGFYARIPSPFNRPVTVNLKVIAFLRELANNRQVLPGVCAEQQDLLERPASRLRHSGMLTA